MLLSDRHRVRLSLYNLPFNLCTGRHGASSFSFYDGSE
jgi:hypothetical protein